MPITKIRYKKSAVSKDALEQLVLNLQGIIVDALSVPGAVLLVDDVSLEFDQASKRDIGPDLRILTLAHDYPKRVENASERAVQIRTRVIALIGNDAITVATPIFFGHFGVSGG